MIDLLPGVHVTCSNFKAGYLGLLTTFSHKSSWPRDFARTGLTRRGNLSALSGFISRSRSLTESRIAVYILRVSLLLLQFLCCSPAAIKITACIIPYTSHVIDRGEESPHSLFFMRKAGCQPLPLIQVHNPDDRDAQWRDHVKKLFLML